MVGITTLAARESDVGQGKGLSPDDYERIVEENEEYKAVFQAFMTGENLLSWIADISSGEYIDYKECRCNFKDPSFAELLAWCKRMKPETENGQSVNYGIEETVLSLEMLSCFERLPVIRRNFQGSYVFTGFPCDNGQGNYYTCAYGCCAAIPSTAQNKEGAWALIREHLMMQRQIDAYNLDGFPVNLEAFERTAGKLLEDEDHLRIMDLLSDTTKACGYQDAQLREIIIDSGTAYLRGDKTLEDTVDLIQSRVGVFISEKYG